MPGAVELSGEEGASPLPAEERKRKGQGRGRKGKRRRSLELDHGSRVEFGLVGRGVEVMDLENGALQVGGYDGVGDGVRGGDGALCDVGEMGMEINGVGRKSLRGLDDNASPGTMEEEERSEESRDLGEPPSCTPSVDVCGCETIKLEPDISSGPNAEIEVKNGEDGGAQANGDVSSKDGKDTPLDAPRKRKRHSAKEMSTPDMPLRRSARRAAAATLLSPPSAHVDSKDEPAEEPALEEKCSLQVAKETFVLPPSSRDLELDGLPVLDVFSVYACLRSFSTLLFLSPFSLKAFVAAIKCNFTNTLIDSVHYSILLALKPHLERLSEEGSQTASDCLRNLNWELLDMVNWPLYLAEYLLFHHSTLSSSLKLLNGEYYEQPASAKLEVLRYLCDDVIEVEIIRSELNRRMLESEVNIDIDQNASESKGKDVNMGALHTPFSSKEVLEEMSDGNSDECCLCKMDGSLICCDGCPAAFHTRCVGMARDLLPEGEWFCPECLMGKVDRKMKPSKPFQGAEILGIDPHGRIYFGSCGYLLVSEPLDTGSSYHYYNRDDLNSIIEYLKTSYISHAGILSAICAHWCIPLLSPGSGLHMDWDGHEDYMDVTHRFASQMVSSLKDEMAEEENAVEKEQDMNSSSSHDHQCFTSLESCKFESATRSQISVLTCPDAFCEGFPASERVHGHTVIPVLQRTEATCITDSPSTSDIDLSSKCCELMQEKHIEPLNSDHKLFASERTNDAAQVHLDISGYVNCYSFGRIASSVAEELSSKSSDNITKDRKVSAEDIISAQLRTIYKKSTNRYWSAILKLPANAQKESCGWCFACKNPSEQECLLRIIENKMLVGSRNRMLGIHSKDNRKNHILSVVHHMLQVEDNSHGLLSGPWQNPHHKRQWRKNVLKAVDVTSLKYLLLTLELHLRRVVLSAEWLKPVDSSLMAGSASYASTSERGGGRKNARKNVSETKRIPDVGSYSLSNCASTSVTYWWRGGKLSRQVFRWKMLPRSLASKGARQAGCRKIPGILYPEGSELAKRSKYIAWRAAVEMSQNVAQLAYHVKDLDSNIRWNDLSNSQPLPQLVKESRKSLKPSWKAIICQKSVEGAQVKYLIDFGKRKIIPDVVTKHGVLQEETNESKKYWLDESHLPVNLLKAFEVRNLEQMLKNASSEVVSSEGTKCRMVKLRRQRGLTHLLSRGEKTDQNICGHCDKVVLEREEAVNCQFCKGLIHKKHFRVPKGATATTYRCYSCKDKKFMSESRETKRPNGCKEKRFANESKDKKPVDGCRDKKSMMGRKDKKGMNKDAKFLRERKDKKLVDGCDGKKLSNRCKGKKIVDSHQEKKPADGFKDKKSVNEFNKKVLSRPRKRKTKLGKSKVLVLRKSERLAKKKQHVTKSKKWNVGRKKSKQSQMRKDKQVVSKTSKDGIRWHKRQRTGLCPPYWLNGLLWTRKAYDEHAIHFRETRVLLPFPNSKANLQPVCSLCHKEYDSHVIYVGCENCGDWFHGDAFALTLVNINNIRGFKCHRCRAKSTPVCPYFSNVVDEVNLLKEQELDVNHVGDNSTLQCLVYDSQDLLHEHDLSSVVHCQKFMDEDQRAVAIPDSGQILVLEKCNETTAEIVPMDEGSHLLTEAEHSCVKYDEIKVVDEDHPL